MRILGLASHSHDTGVALIEDGRIVSVLEEERHNREKHTQAFPISALRLALGEDGNGLSGLDAITTPWDPKRLRRTFTTALARRFPLSLHLARPSAHPTQNTGIFFHDFWARHDLKETFPGKPVPPMVSVGHHEAHASLFFVSPFEEATILVMDGYGDDAATSVFTGAGNRLERRWHGRFFDSLGMLYTLVTCHLGFQPFEEGTVMALAAMGSDRLVDKMRDVVRLEPGGRFAINTRYCSFDRYGALHPFKRPFIEAFGPARARSQPLEQHHRDLAFALQTVAEDIVLHVAKSARQSYPSANLCLVGGVALNCVANARLLREAGFERLWVPPCASDTGVPLGSALWHYHQTLGQPRREVMTHAYYGQEFSAAEIEAALKRAGLDYACLDDDDLIADTAQALAAGRIVGWFQGRYEVGPRALGNRSILASPLSPSVRDVINARVKYREPFRPFAPAVLAEAAPEYFEITQADPFMTLAPRVRPEMAARIPAAVHVDGTARLQTVERASNQRFHALIARFGELTGVPVLINTSFNKQEPIVTRPEEAISCYLRTDMDMLVLGNCVTTARPHAAVQQAREQFEVIEINTRSGE